MPQYKHDTPICLLISARNSVIHLARHVYRIAFRCGDINVVLQCPWLLQGIEVDGAGRCAVQLAGQFIEIGLPAHVVEVAQEAVPLLVGIVAQAAVIGRDTVAPRGDLHTGVPFVAILLLGRMPKARAFSIQWPTLNSERVASSLSCKSIRLRKRREAAANSSLLPDFYGLTTPG